MQNNKCLEIIEVPDVLNENKNIFFCNEEIILNKSDIIEHYKEIIRLLNKHQNYNLYLDENLNSNISVFMKTDGRTIVEKHTSPSTMFSIEEDNMNSAFYYYFDESFKFSKIQNKEDVIKQLKKLTS